VEERDEYMEGQQNAPAWFFLLIWLGWVAVTIAGYLAGQWLSENIASVFVGDTASRVLSIEGRVQAAGVAGYAVALIGGAVAGGVLGLAQGLLLLPFLKRAGTVEWILATILGRAVQWMVVYSIGVEMTGLVVDKSFGGVLLLFAFLAATGILSGAALGYPQSQVFKRRAHGVGWLVFANMLGPVVTSLVLGMTLLVEAQDTMRDYATLLTAILLAVATGFALQELLHHPRSTAEWRKTLTWRRTQRPRGLADDTVLGSALYTPRAEPATTRPPAGVEPGSEARPETRPGAS
jgi:hypothetical protein